jgi:hypothetical protein
MHPTVKTARLAGAIYLSEIVVGPFNLIYVPRALFVSGDPTATAANILAHETMFKLAILSLALYRLFEDVDRFQAAAMVIFGGLMIAPIFFLNSLNWIAALTLVQGGNYSSAFTTQQQEALAILFSPPAQSGQHRRQRLLGFRAVPIRLARGEHRGAGLRRCDLYLRSTGILCRNRDHALFADQGCERCEAPGACGPSMNWKIHLTMAFAYAIIVP